MVTQSRDTHQKAEDVQIELLRKATPERRLELGLSLCQGAIDIVRHKPSLGPILWPVRWIKSFYLSK